MGFYEQVNLILEGTRFKGIDGYKPIPLTQKEEEYVTLISIFLQRYYFKLAKQPFARPGGKQTDEAIFYPDEDYLSRQIYKFLCTLIGYPTKLRGEDWYYIGGTFMEMDREPSVHALIFKILPKKNANFIWRNSKYSISLKDLLGGMDGWGRENFIGVYNDLEKIKEVVRTGMYAFVGSMKEFDEDQWSEPAENGRFFRQLTKYRQLRTMKPATQKHFGDIITGLNESFEIKIDDRLKRFLTYVLNINYLQREKYRRDPKFNHLRVIASSFHRLFKFDPTRYGNKFYGNFYLDLQRPYLKYLNGDELQAIRNIVGKNDITRYFNIYTQQDVDNVDKFDVGQLLSAIDKEDREEKGIRILAIIFNALARTYSEFGHKDWETYIFESGLKPETQKHFGGIFNEL